MDEDMEFDTVMAQQAAMNLQEGLDDGRKMMYVAQ